LRGCGGYWSCSGTLSFDVFQNTIKNRHGFHLDMSRWFWILQQMRPAKAGRIYHVYFPGLKESFRLTLRLKTKWPGAQSLLSGQK